MRELDRLTKDIAGELVRLGFRVFDPSGLYLQSEKLNARIIRREDHTDVQFGERKTFDRWSNSINFFVCIQHDEPSADLEWAIAQAERICDSGLFNFASYFHAIELTR